MVSGLPPKASFVAMAFVAVVAAKFSEMDTSNISRLSGHTKFVEGCSYSADGTRLISCSGDESVLLWDTQTRQKLQIIGNHEAEVWSCDFSKYGIYVCSASSDKTVRIWDQRSQGEIARFTGHDGTVWTCAFDSSWSSWRIASGSSDMAVKIWNWKTLSVEEIFENHGNTVDHVMFSENGETLVSCGRDKTVQIVENFQDISKRRVKRLFGHEERVTFCDFLRCSGENKLVSCSDDKTIRVWDRTTGKNTCTIQGHLNTVWCCDSRPLNDTTLLISASSDKTLRFWDLANGVELKRIRELDDGIESEDQLLCCHFSPDLTQLAVTSNNGNIYLIQMGDILQEIFHEQIV